MKQEVKDKMLSTYQNLSLKKKATCLKYFYKYNKVNVNVFFDAYDEDSMAFNMILAFEKNYYFTPLNITNDKIRKEYLTQIPTEILSNILVDNHLDDFFNTMEDYILNNNPIINFYNNDKIFVNTVAFNKNDIDLPFWHHIRKSRMTEKTLEELSERADISRNTLKKIQENGMTLVRTGDPLKRKKLTMILEEERLKLV